MCIDFFLSAYSVWLLWDICIFLRYISSAWGSCLYLSCVCSNSVVFILGHGKKIAFRDGDIEQLKHVQHELKKRQGERERKWQKWNTKRRQKGIYSTTTSVRCGEQSTPSLATPKRKDSHSWVMWIELMNSTSSSIDLTLWSHLHPLLPLHHFLLILLNMWASSVQLLQ